MSNPIFQHRHYKAIASVLADARASATTPVEHGVINDLEARLVTAFKADNPKFSVARFEAASSRSPDMHGKDKA